MPWVVALILGGMVIGPHGLGVLEINSTVSFFGDIGLVFLMFMAGLEIRLSSFKDLRKSVFAISVLGASVPFAVGFGIAYLFGYSISGSLLLGIVFIASSVGVIVPLLEHLRIHTERIGKTIIASAVVLDVFSLLLLAFFFQTSEGNSVLPLPVFYILLIVALVVLRLLIPKVQWFFAQFAHTDTETFQQELRSVLVVLFGVVIAFELIGLHEIIAGFFAGMVLSESIQSEILHIKLRALGYGLFIPVFFIIVGAKTDISLLSGASGAGLLSLCVVGGLILSKFTSTFLGSYVTGFSVRQSAFIGTALTPHLSTALAVAFSGLSLGIIDDKMITALVLLSIVTTLIAPIFLMSEYRFIGQS